MSSIKLINLLALLSVAFIGLSLGPTPVSAVSAGHAQHARRVDHHVVAKKRRGASNKRCKQRPSSSLSSSVATATSDSSTPASTASSYKVDPTTTAPASTTVPASTTAHPTTTTSSPSAPAPVQNGKAQCKGKASLAWPNGDWIDIEPWVTEQSCYVYTWDSSYPKKTKELGLRPLIMLWGGAGDKIDAFRAAVNNPDNAGGIVMGFNEPNEAPPQSNMSPSWAADVWAAEIEPLRQKGFKTCCPATSSNPNGEVWVKDFLKACNGRCTCDYHAAHYYDVSVQGFKDYMTNWHNAFGKPMFVTEFACQNFNGGAQCSPQQVDSFWREVIAWMKEQPWIEAYMGFGAMHDMYNVNVDNRMMGDDGKPNDFGMKYIQGW